MITKHATTEDTVQNLSSRLSSGTGSAGGLVVPSPAAPMLHRRALLTTAGAATLVACTFPRSASRAAALRSFYVASSGNDANAGTQASPWRTINRAMSAALLPGDEVVVGAGTYTEQISIGKGGNADSATGYITLRSATRGSALLRPPSGTYSTLSVRANYVIIDGFDVRGGSGHGIDVESCHHVKVINNTVHDSGGSGIQYNSSEWITIEQNVCYQNAFTNGYQCSGISVYQARNITRDISTPGFRTIIRNNICYANFEHISGDHTDGNGIIVDDFQSTQTAGFPNYTFPTLVENNLCHSNGGKGIQVTWSDFVTVRNNTCWHNNLDNQNSGTWRGELNNQQSSNNKWINNIGVADPSVNRYNSAIGNMSYNNYKNQNTVWYNNLTFNGVSGQSAIDISSGNAAPTAQNGNLLGVDPLFVTPAPTAFDFRLRSGSPAINAGTSAFGVGTNDLARNARTSGTIDIGAYEQGATETPPPEEPPEEPPGPIGTPGSIWTLAATPAIANANDAQAVELGVKFRVTVNGSITAIRFYKGSRNSGTHTASLWSSAGVRLATATLTTETASGWQTVKLASPVAVTAGQTYVASYYTKVGYYSVTQDYFAANVQSGSLVALGDGVDGANGVYRYGSSGFPRNSYRKSNYWVDVIYQP